MSKQNANEVVGLFVLEHADSLDVRSRAKLYRAMSELIGDESDARSFSRLAIDLEEAERRHLQLKLDFKSRTA